MRRTGSVFYPFFLVAVPRTLSVSHKCVALPGEDGGGVTTMYTPLLNGTDDHVGLFGDSNQYVMAEWIPIQQDGTVAPGDWNSDTGVCTNLVTRMHLTLYTAAVGNVLEPQNKIVGAYRSYGMETVGHSGSDNLKQRMELRTVVTFVELPNRVLEEQVRATAPVPCVPLGAESHSARAVPRSSRRRASSRKCPRTSFTRSSCPRAARVRRHRCWRRLWAWLRQRCRSV